MEDIVELNGLTKGVVEVGFTPEELAQREKDSNDWLSADKERIKEEKEKSVSKSVALAKLLALGLTEDEVHAIIEQ
jgi:hypothetical protein